MLEQPNFEEVIMIISCHVYSTFQRFKVLEETSFRPVKSSTSQSQAVSEGGGGKVNEDIYLRLSGAVDCRLTCIDPNKKLF